ncbi:putative serine/threonine-protein kinase pim-3 [Triplophysa rosa]|uniref:non-specific serine/threonine protein kinase n=1 Tax=Triplophysa rosa TaxID=992332 RepID=A0A9W7TDG8_TRIRA|nr:putative serine/threonine-protein kinase pim-3 [Triplophysa rosa]
MTSRLPSALGAMMSFQINCCQYEIGRELGQGGFGTVYEGTRVRDGVKVAVKVVRKNEHVMKDYMDIPGYPEPIPREVYLQMLACKGEHVPVIVRFLDWQDRLDHYVMVLERPSPCEDLSAFMIRNGGRLTEKLARLIMEHVTEAAEICCNRGVFHRDIKMENLLINPCTLDVTLIDFGCGDLLKNSAYTEYMGTRIYTCPEFIKTGKYHGKPATVYSLGVLLFALVCGKFPDRHDRHRINKKIWHEDGLTEDCCDLIQACMEKNPEKRIQLEEILNHKCEKNNTGNEIGDNRFIRLESRIPRIPNTWVCDKRFRSYERKHVYHRCRAPYGPIAIIL